MSTCLQLALTKIGDLLLHDTITQDTDGKPMTGIRLVIPDYQRPYKWTAKNAIQLFDDTDHRIYSTGNIPNHKVQQTLISDYTASGVNLAACSNLPKMAIKAFIWNNLVIFLIEKRFITNIHINL